MTDDNHIDLSRRKVLGSLGAIGVASAGAGFGTSAYFNDEESFDNVITAGKLNLMVDYYSYWDQGKAGKGSLSETADGDAVSFELGDVKPGDSGTMAFCPRINSNPAYLWLGGELTENHGNGLTEPEAEVDDADGAGEGELAQSIDVTVSYCELNEVGDKFKPNKDIESSTEIWSGSLADFLTENQMGLPLDGDGDEGGERACFDASGDNTCLCIDWEIPTDVGNEIQTDSVGFDLQFYAEQCRHNDGENNPYCTELSLDLEEQYNQLLDITLPDPYVLEIEVEDENGDPFTGEITAADHGNDEFVWVTDHLGEFDETPENRYGAYVELDFDDDGTAQILFGNVDDADVSYLGLDVNDVTENIEVNVGEVIDGLEVTSMCVSTGIQ
ncbi:SipW-dependent-type signal peptide-containing protein [Natronoarchaeum mannanilyticum]|uniref:SipW-cognate class signal peptide n=1 Tax=Natronoarchaeum mannanilyticum TaxID=926360 RepID=A0AAV3T7Q6_9EURY